METNVIRRKYLSFFEKKGHSIFPSDSLVPEDDPTLLFTGAGMNQFKDMFLGKGKLDVKRATTCQKCIRTGDIENVGRTPMHHTFFEMLGNFSFGDYFKLEAIEMAWEFMLNEMKLPEERLSVSVYLDDEESYDIWLKKIGVPKDNIYRFGEKENFWPANAPSDGPNGPCGPCSEIFYDRGEDIGCGRKECAPDCDCGRFVEVWNLVFTQFDRRDGGALEPLPNKNVDTGMGLERMASVMQGVGTNFEIDIFKPIIQNISEITEVKYDNRTENGKLMNRIADHIRAIIFCISDGVLPGNEGRGYVERRLLRRAVRDGLKLGKEDCFLYKLVPIIADVMHEAYPEIKQRRENIARIIKNEEERFHETLFMGNKRLDELMEGLRKCGQKTLSGQEAFQLYDTFGFPIEMTEELASENNLTIDKAGFDEAYVAHQELSRQGSEQKFKGGMADHGEMSVKYHTATHLLHAALRQVLGNHVEQKGSNITAERMRFDFSYNDKMTSEQIKEVEDLVNSAIDKDYPVSFSEMTVEEAKAKGAIGLFVDKYGERVKVYTVGDPEQSVLVNASSPTFSREICGGPHVEHTGVMGHFKIVKEESSSAGIRRIKAVLE